MPTIDQRAAANRWPSTPLHQQLGEAERAVLTGHHQPSLSPGLQHNHRSVEATLQPHACERLSPFEQQLIQQSPTERELSKLISDQPAEVQ
ncbi:hypothetical protein [Pseudomonas anguilliseptica]|uniref:hypothetical protein n=1 Tax=Pseudomonas anguilliseptica TaxID=53406 RepID=UPI000B8913D3|nr:hypothetical protein [Pseudomonas anguilliseptica]